MKKITTLIALGALAVSSHSFSALYYPDFGSANTVLTNGQCNTASVSITGIYENNGSIDTSNPGASVGGLSYPISSTSCLGFVTTPDNDWGKEPSPNIGGLYDGLLNGEVTTFNDQGDKTDYYVDPNQFLTNPNDTWVDENTPGWITLAQSDNDQSEEWISDGSYSFVNGYDLNDVLDISFSNDGSWSLLVDPAAIPLASQALGRPAVFDHLTFVLKGSNNQDASWAIFDFNFWDLLDQGLDISLGDTAYYFTGAWDPQVINNQDLSHVTIWAHDPLLATQIPTPSTLWLVGLVLLLTSRAGLAGRFIR